MYIKAVITFLVAKLLRRGTVREICQYIVHFPTLVYVLIQLSSSVVINPEKNIVRISLEIQFRNFL